jgi:hypothetical protein
MRPQEETERLNRIVEHLLNLEKEISRAKYPEGEPLTEEELRYLELHGALPESTSQEPLRTIHRARFRLDRGNLLLGKASRLLTPSFCASLMEAGISSATMDFSGSHYPVFSVA